MPFVRNASDMSRFMRTCSTTYEFGITPFSRSCSLIRRRHSALQDVTSFHLFVHSSPQRPLLLRELVLPTFSFGRLGDVYPTAELLADIIQHAANLEVLRIGPHRGLSRLLRDKSEHLYTALLLHRNIQTIDMTVGEIEVSLLCDMASPITKAVLDFSSMDPSDTDDDWGGFEPTVTLQRFSGTLEELHLLDLPDNTIFSHTFDYLRVHSLAISARNWESFGFSPEDLSFVFPNLKNLNLRCDTLPNDLIGRRLWRQKAATRSTGIWPVLDKLSCSISLSYSLLLTCSVRLWHGVVIKEALHVARFRTVLGDIHPQHLDIAIHARDVHFHTTESFSRIFPPADITYLNINLLAMYAQSDIDWDGSTSWISHAIVSLCQLRTLTTTLTFSHL